MKTILSTANKLFRDGNYELANTFYQKFIIENPELAYLAETNLRLLQKKKMESKDVDVKNKVLLNPIGINLQKWGIENNKIAIIFLDDEPSTEKISQFKSAIKLNSFTSNVKNIISISLRDYKECSNLASVITNMSNELDFIYIEPFSVSKSFWINQILMRHDVDAFFLVGGNVPTGEAQFNSKVVETFVERLKPSIAFDCALQDSNKSGSEPTLIYINKGIVREEIGYFLPIKFDVAIVDYIDRIVRKSGLSVLGEGAKEIYNDFLLKDNRHDTCRYLSALHVHTIRKIRSIRSSSQFEPAVLPQASIRFIHNDIGPENTNVIYGNSMSPDSKKKSEVNIFTFDSYLSRAALQSTKNSDDIFFVPGKTESQKLKVITLSNNLGELSLAPGIISAISLKEKYLKVFDLLPVGPVQNIDLDFIHSQGRVPLIPSFGRIQKFRSPNAHKILEKLRAKQPLTSIVSTAFNSDNTILWALYSCLQQSHRNIEYIIVDDCSSDRTLKYASEFLSHYPKAKIKIITSPKNRGAYVSRNIGILESNGSYVTSHDLDDYSSAQRIFLCVFSCHNFGKRMLTTNHSRVDEYGNILQLWNGTPGKDGIERRCLATLFYEKSVCRDIGFFDPVRKSGDSEFFERASHHLQPNAVGHIEANMLYAVLDQVGKKQERLTQDLFSKMDGDLQMKYEFHRSEERSTYEAHFRNNHTDKSRFHPLNVRFEDALNHSYRIVANVATIPRRVSSFKKMLQNIIPQVSHINVFLNEFEVVPEELLQIFEVYKTMITTYRSQEIGNLRDNAKFYCIDNNNSYYLTLDDDIIYPWDYVSRLIGKSKLYNDQAVLCVHGYSYWNPIESFHKDPARASRYFHFEYSLNRDVQVDNAGTGTVLIPPGLNLHNLNYGPFGIVDVLFAEMARKADIPIIAISRKERWLKSVGIDKQALYHVNQSNDRESMILAHIPSVQFCVPFSASRPKVLRTESYRNALSSFYSLGLSDERLNTTVKKLYICCTGYNFEKYAEKFIRSLQATLSQINYYNATILFFDDCSDDGSINKLHQFSSKYLMQWEYKIYQASVNFGPAFGRAFLLESIADLDAICIFLDIDDEVTPDIVRRILCEYTYNSDLKLTFGSWAFNDVVKRAFPLYSESQIQAKSYMMPPFKFGHPRSFRASLFSAAHKDLLIAPDGSWLKYCTDLALILGMLDQLEPGNISRIFECLYKYNIGTENGTIKKYGAFKNLIRDYLYSAAHTYYELAKQGGGRANAAYRNLMDRDAFNVKLLNNNEVGFPLIKQPHLIGTIPLSRAVNDTATDSDNLRISSNAPQ